MSLTHAYAGEICKFDRTPDGDLLVYGKATGPDLDLDEQVCDPSWLKAAMPEWAQWSNIRAMHGAVAAGVGLETVQGGDDWFVKSLITDRESAHKVETGTYKGYSIGIKNARVVKDAKAPGGRIVGGTIAEISLVDRPCNPTATVAIAKAAQGSTQLQPVEAEPQDGVDLDKAALIDVITEGRADAKSLTLAGDRDRVGAPAFDRDLALAIAGYAAAGDRAAVLALLPADADKAVNADGMQDEAPDIAGGKQVIDLLGQLIAAEAAELSAGYLDESCDIRILLQAVEAVSCWLGKEQSAVTSPDKPYAQGDDDDSMVYIGLSANGVVFKYVSAAKRDEYAKSGIAMPNGDFPIPDEGHLRSAVGHYGGYTGDKAAAKKHIIARAKALNLVRLLPDDWGVPGADADKRAPAGAIGAAGSAAGVAVATAGALVTSPSPTPNSGGDDVRGLSAHPGADAGRVLDDAEDDRAKAARKARKKARKTGMNTGQPNPDAVTAATAPKAATPDTTTGATIDDQNVTDIVKAAVTEATRPYEERIEALTAQLAKVLETPMPGGPVLIAPQQGSSERSANLNKAAQFRAIAAQSGDPSVARAYRAKAAELEAAERQ